tara:strand:+ start:525 stop:710 length:186 start_codon:yes stop_codon:yes gene_type:complete
MSFIFFLKGAKFLFAGVVLANSFIKLMSESKDSKSWFPDWVALLMLFLWPVPLIVVLLIWS